MDDHLPYGDSNDKVSDFPFEVSSFSSFFLLYAIPPLYRSKNTQLSRSAVKSVVAGIAGAVLTNPLDVIRNEYVSFVYFYL